MNKNVILHKNTSMFTLIYKFKYNMKCIIRANMKIGVVRFPGTNCFYDTVRYFGKDNCVELWYKNDYVENDLDLLIIPGGFAFGDRKYETATGAYVNDPGAMTIGWPITKLIYELYKKQVPILGICNGFQILIKMGLLSGELTTNKSKKFMSNHVKLLYEFSCDTIKYSGCTEMKVANYSGNYQNNDINERNIFLRYDGFDNGSVLNIAGIHNDEKTVFGMMPHPERNSGFKEDLLNILLHKKGLINNKINMLLNSEHISYKSTKGFLRNLYVFGEHVVQGPGENAGIVDIGGGYCITMRIESHNHPTFKNAFEGAATGVGGIIRDIICMGSKPIALLDFLRFGDDENSKQLLERAIEGIAYYGNTIGIPNVGGSLHISEIYNKNPLVNVACLGIVKKDKIIYGNALNEGSIFILCGAKTGNEGVDSAIMASLPSNGEEEKNAQKADAYLENLLLDAFCELSESGLVEGCQDLGAGGILCATTEVVHRGRQKTKKPLGCDIFLEHVALKCELDNYSILASESQERMLLICTKDNSSEIIKILDKWDLESNIIGEVNETSEYRVFKNGVLVYTESFYNFKEVQNNINLKYMEKYNSLTKTRDIDLWRVYDHTIGCRTIKGPDEPGAYSILDIYEINKKLIITWGVSVQDCNSKMVSLNGKPLGIVNGLNFGNPESCLGDFDTAINDMNYWCESLSIPVLGGNVSMYNCTGGRDIYPSIVIVMIGLIKY